MSSLTSPRNTVRLEPQVPYGQEQPMAASAAVVQGCLVALDGSSGAAVNMTKTTGLRCIGIAVQSVDNSAGDLGDLSCVAQSGLVLLDTGASADQVVQADVGNLCYALDNHTVTPQSSGASAVGIVQSIVLDGPGAGQVIVAIEPT